MSEPSFGHRKPIVREETKSYKGWIIGGLIALGVFFVLFKMYSHSSNYRASSTVSPAPVTTVPGPASGSGTAGVTRAPAPTVVKPQRGVRPVGKSVLLVRHTASLEDFGPLLKKMNKRGTPPH